MTAPCLLLACGTPERGDDALGPAFAQRARRLAGRAEFDIVVDYQFLPEHAVDLLDRRRVLFVDAAVGVDAPYVCVPVVPALDRSFSSHRLTPGAVLAACATAFADAKLPAAELLAIRGYAFDLGAPLSVEARFNLAAALEFLDEWLRRPA